MAQPKDYVSGKFGKLKNFLCSAVARIVLEHIYSMHCSN